MFTWKSHASLKFHFGQNDRYEIHTILSFISPQFMWTQVKSWLNTKVRYSTEMKSHTGLSSFRLSYERTPCHLIVRFHCGTRKHFRFPSQLSPTLSNERQMTCLKNPDKFICIHLILFKFSVLYEDFKIALD